MSLTTRILTAIGLLAALVTALLIADLLPAHELTRQVDERQRLNAISGLLVEAGGALAIERGLLSGLLAAHASPDPATRTKLEITRARAIRMLDQALPGLPATDTSNLQTAMAALAERRIAAAAALDGAGHGLPATEWFASATAAIETVVTARRHIDAAASSESLTTSLITLRDRLAEMSEFAGRLRGSVNQLISRGGHATGVESQRAAAIAARVEAAWAEIAVRLDAFPRPLQAPLAAAQQGWFKDFAPLREAVLQAAATGQDWPAPPSEWFHQATVAIDTLLAAQAASGVEIEQTLADERAGADRKVALASIMLAFGLLTAGAAFWYVSRRVAAPLRKVIDAINRLAAGELDMLPPDSASKDEIGQLCRATTRFRNTALEARDLVEARDSLAADNARDRAAAVREIGDQIETLAQGAIERVRASTTSVASLAAQAHGTAAGITAGIEGAAGDAGSIREAANSTALNASELQQAIQEIATQMSRAAGATRATVDQTAAARETFVALQSSVSEIGEVAGLIAALAARTNLLALNATIEAARAGAAGKGFAVVASEVKALAAETARSTEQISSRISIIGPVTEAAMAAMVGVTRAVTDIDSIATAVAAAVEQQSMAVVALAQGAGQSSKAATSMAERMGGMTRDAKSCETIAAEMDTLAQGISLSVGGLKADLSRMMRSRIAELDRRTQERHQTSAPASLDLTGVVYPGKLVDISTSGAGFFPNTAIPNDPGTLGALKIDGLPPIKVRYVGGSDNHAGLQWVEGQPEAENAVRTLVDRLAHNSVRKAA